MNIRAIKQEKQLDKYYEKNDKIKKMKEAEREILNNKKLISEVFQNDIQNKREQEKIFFADARKQKEALDGIVQNGVISQKLKDVLN